VGRFCFWEKSAGIIRITLIQSNLLRHN